MYGDIEVQVSNPRIHYEFILHRNITVLADEGSTGKTSLIRLIEKAAITTSTKVSVSNNLSLIALTKDLWDNIFFNDLVDPAGPRVYIIDESAPFLTSGDFADFVWKSGCYFILVTRDSLPSLACSTKEIYRLQTIGRITTFVQLYPETMYGLLPAHDVQCITEDSRFGKIFFERVYSTGNIVSAYGKDKVLNLLNNSPYTHPVVIVDGAAFGFNMANVLEQIRKLGGCLIVEESFEYVILTSGIFSRYEHQLESEMLHIEAKKYKTWERFFNMFLEKITAGTKLQYKKDGFNTAYLLPSHKEMILHRYGLPCPQTSSLTDDHDDKTNLFND